MRACGNLNTFERTLLELFRSDLGKLEMPMYYDDYEKGYVAEYWQIWLFWYTSVVFMFVVMLNFMIAVITDTYQRVLQMSEQFTFNH
jgi:hypothetical protein